MRWTWIWLLFSDGHFEFLGVVGAFAILGAIFLRVACSVVNLLIAKEGAEAGVRSIPDDPQQFPTPRPGLHSSTPPAVRSDHITLPETGTTEHKPRPYVPDERTVQLLSPPSSEPGVPVPTFLHALVMAAAALVLLLTVVIWRAAVFQAGVRDGNGMEGYEETGPVSLVIGSFGIAVLLTLALPTTLGRACIVLGVGVVLLVVVLGLVWTSVIFVLGPV